jgi:RNA polymerase sigma factor (sigma-70 family)
MPDADLLRRYAEERDEAAFELLLWRHGAMVWGVCRRVAADRSAAEDAFQAAAFALARHAASIRRGASVAGWLYRVAYRAALRTRSRRPEEPMPAEQPGREPDPADAAESRELSGVIDAEVSRLPEPFRLALVLCDLEGRSNADAAAAMGCPVGTVESRLTRARQRLRDRLARRGVVLSAGALAVGAVPARVHAAGVRAATDPASVPPPVRHIATHAAGTVRPGFLVAAGLALLAGVALAAGLVAANRPDPPAPPHPKAAEPAKPADNAAARRLGSDRFRHSGPVFHSAFSADGKKLATAALGSVSVWEAATGKLLHRIERARVPFHRVAFTPDEKALYVVVGPLQEGCELLTLDPATGKELAKLTIGPKVYHGAEFSPDATRLAVFTMNVSGETVLVDPKAGKELARVPAFFRGSGFTADGKSLVVAGGEEVVRVYDSTTGKELAKLEPNRDRPQWARFLTRTDVLFAFNNSVERWDLEKKKRIWQTEPYLPSGSGLELSPDGDHAAHLSPHGVTLVDVETGKQPIRGADRIGGTSARFSPDSKILAVTTTSGTVALLDTRSGATLPQSADLLGAVQNLTFTADGRYLVAVSGAVGIVGDRWVRWDLSAAEPRAEALAKFVTLSPDGRVGMRPDTFYRGGESPAEFVDPVTGKTIANLDPPETGDTVVISRADYRKGLFSGDGKRFVGFRLTPRNAGGGQQELGLATWDTATGKRLTQRDPDVAEKERYFPQVVSPDGKAVVVSFADGQKVRLGLWEPDGDTLRWTRELTGGYVFAAFADGGKKLVVQEYYVPRLLLGPMPPIPPGPYPFFTLDAATGKELAKANGPDLGEHPLVYTESSYGPTPVANARAVSPDGRTLAISGWDGTIHLWDLAADRGKAKFAHPGPVHDLAFSPNGKSLAAASQAAPVLVYDLTAPKR